MKLWRLLFAGSIGLPKADSSTVDRPAAAAVARRAVYDGNTASTRSTWCEYSMDTDYLSEAIDTGITREYWLELTDVTVAPDGYL
ncbi:hypothetical protein FVEN_g12708 [Fusarium venenatum]|uniref:Uncharacterized protein n=1 Tax=Fusarium venenatum TaxID=56646 RepID=A0A2L2T9F7_9HYPO|nr:uncharacterized protein FVRRES_06337 [Fusarium venenatum]KAG8359405.1 hypothetical protein FVEN_g12708 [Fusarium venenatum]CEI61901.1 unnamed protein product [Fusarium venenatum]